MTQPVDQATKDLPADGLDAVANDAQQLVKSVTAVSVEKANALRASVERNLVLAKERFRTLQLTASEGTRAPARATDEYVHLKPWAAIGFAAGVGFVVGAAIGVSMNRR